MYRKRGGSEKEWKTLNADLRAVYGCDLDNFANINEESKTESQTHLSSLPYSPVIARGGNPFWMPLPVEPTRYDQSSPYSGGETGRSVDEYPVFSALAQRISYLHDQPGSAAVTGMGHGRGAVYLRPTQTSPDLDDIRKNPSRISLSNIIRDQQAGLQVSGESGHRGQQRADQGTVANQGSCEGATVWASSLHVDMSPQTAVVGRAPPSAPF